MNSAIFVEFSPENRRPNRGEYFLLLLEIRAGKTSFLCEMKNYEILQILGFLSQILYVIL